MKQLNLLSWWCLSKDFCFWAKEFFSQWLMPTFPDDPSGLQDKSFPPCRRRALAVCLWVGARLPSDHSGAKCALLCLSRAPVWLTRSPPRLSLSWQQTRPHTGPSVTSYHAALCNDMPHAWSWPLSARPSRWGNTSWLMCVLWWASLDVQWETWLGYASVIQIQVRFFFLSVVNHC